VATERINLKAWIIDLKRAVPKREIGIYIGTIDFHAEWSIRDREERKRKKQEM